MKRRSEFVTAAALADLKSAVPLPALIARHVVLKRQGAAFIGLCPFHKEKTLSFRVYSDHYHCFACGAHGDAISSLMQIESKSFSDAVRHLSGSGLPEPKIVEAHPHEREAKQERRFDNASSILRASISAKGTNAENYLASRRLRPAMNLGFNPKVRHKTGAKLPAMVANVMQVTGAVTGCHCTVLLPDGSGKAAVTPDKQTFGLITGGAVWLAPLQPVRDANKAATPAPEMPDRPLEPDEPVRPRIMVNYTTPEKLGELAAAHDKGLLFVRDELAGWFGAFDRYSGSGAERVLWLEAYGGRSYTIDRVRTKKPIHIPHLAIGVLGGIQPEKLAQLLSGPDDGLPSRFLWSWPEAIPPRRPSRTPDRHAASTALQRLAALALAHDEGGQPLPQVLFLTEAAALVFQQWRVEHEQNGVGLSGAVASAWGKAPGHVLCLALVLEHLMAARVYGDAALSERDRLAATLSWWIVKEQPKVISVRSLRREARLPGLKETEKICIALALEEADWLRKAPSRSGDSPGRKRKDFLVNPRIAELSFAVEARADSLPAHANSVFSANSYDDFAERAALIECEAVPREWAEGLARLGLMARPEGVSLKCWQQLIDNAGVFLDKFAAHARALGWDTLFNLRLLGYRAGCAPTLNDRTTTTTPSPTERGHHGLLHRNCRDARSIRHRQWDRSLYAPEEWHNEGQVWDEAKSEMPYGVWLSPNGNWRTVLDENEHTVREKLLLLPVLQVAEAAARHHSNRKAVLDLIAMTAPGGSRHQGERR